MAVLFITPSWMNNLGARLWWWHFNLIMFNLSLDKNVEIRL